MTQKIKERTICLVARIKKKTKVSANKMVVECIGTGELFGHRFGLHKSRSYRITVQQLKPAATGSGK